MTKPYIPRGKIVPLIEAVQAEPDRLFTVAQACKLMDIKSNKVGGSLIYALRAGIIFAGKVDGQTAYKGSSFTDGALPLPPAQVKLDRIKPASGWVTEADDPRIPKVVPGWKPPQMSSPRV